MDLVSSKKIANKPTDTSGRLYHLGLREGDLANRIITVGDSARALLIARNLEGAKYTEGEKSLGPNIFYYCSSRGFTTYTGKFQGVNVSIVAIGMGFPMMDFLIREGRLIVDGPMAIIRLGTCGGLNKDDNIGTFMISESSCFIARNVDAFMEDDYNGQFYHISKFCPASPTLTGTLIKEFNGEVYVTGRNATADSFYSSQGRTSEWFVDKNENLFGLLAESDVRTLEMETYYLFHLAHCANKKIPNNRIEAAAVKILLANRHSNDLLFSDEAKHKLEAIGGLACLRTLATYSLST